MYLPNAIVDLLLAIPALSLLAYVPFVCYLDLKYREIEHAYWLPLIIVNIPTMLYMIDQGNVLLYIPGLVAIFVWFTAMRFRFWEGADFMYLSWISLFLIYSPKTGNWMMVLPFSIFFAACMTITTGWVIIYNLLTGKGLTLRFNREVPTMFPISAALMLTVLLA